MTKPTEITGPQDLAQTVRNAVDPLDEHVGYGASTNWPEDAKARAKEMKELLDERDARSGNFRAACEAYILTHPIRSVVVAAGAGAACAALIYAVIDCFGDE